MNSDSIYWNSIEFENEDAAPGMMDQSGRQYVDPWDLENYAYLHSQLESPGSTPPSDDAGFYYTPGTALGTGADRHSHPHLLHRNHQHQLHPLQRSKSHHSDGGQPMDSLGVGSEGTARYAGVDEVDFTNDRRYSSSKSPTGGNYYHQPYNDLLKDDEIYGVPPPPPPHFDPEDYSDSDSPAVADSSLLYVYETAKRFRQMAVPATNRRKSSPNYAGSTYESPSSYYSSSSSGSNSKFGSPRDTPNGPIYDYIKPKPKNFGLSNYGHLKIDYSCNWNSLDRFLYN